MKPFRSSFLLVLLLGLASCVCGLVKPIATESFSPRFQLDFELSLPDAAAEASSYAVTAMDKDGSRMYYTIVSHGSKVVAVNVTSQTVQWTADLPGFINGSSWIVANDGSDTVMVSFNTPRATQAFHSSNGTTKWRIHDLVFDPPPDFQYHAATGHIFAEGYGITYNRFFVINEQTGEVRNSTKCPEVRFNSNFVFLHTPQVPVGNATITAYRIPDLQETWSFQSVPATSDFQQVIAGVSDDYILVRDPADLSAVLVLNASTGARISTLANTTGMWRYPIISSPYKAPQFYGDDQSRFTGVSLGPFPTNGRTFAPPGEEMYRSFDLKTGTAGNFYPASNSSITVEGVYNAHLRPIPGSNTHAELCTVDLRTLQRHECLNELGGQPIPWTTTLRPFAGPLVAVVTNVTSKSYYIVDVRGNTATSVGNLASTNSYLPSDQFPMAVSYPSSGSSSNQMSHHYIFSTGSVLLGFAYQ